MTPNRLMVYHFFDLPTHVQFAIARDFGFTYREVEADNTETFKLWFSEARERGLLDQLRERIELAREDRNA